MMIALLVLDVAHAQPAVAVAPFTVHSSDPELRPLGAAVSDMLTTDLSQLSGVTLVERAQLAAVLGELDLSRTDYVDPARAVQIGKLVNATHLVTGVMTEHDDLLRVDARIVEITSGAVVDAAVVEGATADFFLLEKEVATGVAARLDLVVSPKEQVAMLSRVPSTSLEAVLAWARGLEALDRGRLEAAEAEFAAALEADDGFDAARSALDDLQGRLQRVLDEREQAARDDVGTQLEDLRTAVQQRDAAGIMTSVQAMLQSQSALSVRTRYAQAVAILDAEIPDEFGVSGRGTRPTVTELATYQRLDHGVALGYRSEAVALAALFAERYPDSVYLAGVNARVAQVRRDLDQRARAEAQEGSVRATARVVGHRLRCAGLPSRSERQRACLDWAMDFGTPAPPIWSTVIDAFAWGAPPDAQQRLLSVLATRAPDQVTMAERAFGPLPDHVREQAQRYFKQGDAELFVDQPFSSMRWPERASWLPRMLRKWRKEPRVWAWTVVMPARDGRLAEARTALAEYRSRFGEEGIRWPTREVEAAETRIRDAEHADLHELKALAERLARVQLHERAAEAWIELAEQGPTFEAHSGAASLARAADALTASRGADWDLRRDAVLQQLVDRWPSSPEAAKARTTLDSR